MPDDVLARLPGNGGLCMITFVPDFVSPECAAWAAQLTADMRERGLDPWDFDVREQAAQQRAAADPRPTATLAQVADHVEHVREVAGIGHVGLGGDMDGTLQLPDGLTDVSCYPALFAELLRRGWTEDDCARLAGGNLLRVLRGAEDAARVLAAQRPPCTARIEDLDG